jgi:chromosome segregation ATPase
VCACLQIEERIAGLHSAAAARIASLGEEKQTEYVELQEELVGVNERISEREGVLQSLEREIGSYEETMKSDAYLLLQQGQQLAKENAALSKQKQELEDELNAALSPAEIKEKLTQKIKDGTAETSELESQARKLEAQVERLGDQLRARENELADAKKHSTKARKYEAIYERDAKMQEFIAAFPSVKNEEIENKRRMKETVVALLKHISKELNAAAALAGEGGAAGAGGGADAEKYGELKDEVSFKDKKLADSEKTLASLQVDLAKRREELEKIESLDAKIGAEISQLSEKIAAMNGEMAEFKTEDQLRDQAAEAKARLLRESVVQKRAREAIKTQVALLSSEVEKRNKDLQAQDAYKKIDNWETKLKTHAGAVFTLQEFVTSKKRESDYEGLLKECSEVTKQINNILIQQQK